MDYLSFYGLEQEPFSNTPVSRFYYDSTQHSQAFLRLNRVASQMKGFATLIGDIGAGKTTLARKLLDSFPENEFEAALLVIIHAGITSDWILRRIAQQLGIQKPARQKLPLLNQLYRRLLQISESGKKAVVLIDEAQMLQTKEIMEEFRGLLNLETHEKKLITFIFFGLPELESSLKLDPPLMQRIASRCYLGALDQESCAKYIQHRLNIVGADRTIFNSGAVEAIFRYSQGIPRLINTLADNALFEGYILKNPIIKAEIVENISADLGLSEAKKNELRLVEEESEPSLDQEEEISDPKSDQEQDREQEKISDPKLDQEQEEALENLFSNNVEPEPAALPEAPKDLDSFERDPITDSQNIDEILSGLEEKP